ncbi:MAG: hypothetical protein KTR18_13830, partial [Acidiferrobacterales bacterium]|nr:hypothetical protein [Acidiferrobacterales bacterium]
MNNPTPNQNGKTRKVVFRKKRKKRQKDSSRNIIQKKAVYSRNRITILRDVILNLTVKTRWFSSAILFIYILINSVDFSILLNLSTSGDQLQFTPGGSRFDKILEVEEGIDYRAELNKVIYAATAMMLIFQFKSIVAFVRKNLHLILIIITIAFGVSQSIDSERVIINTIQLLSGLILAIVYALANKNEPYRYINFCSLCMFPLFIIHLFSFIIFVVNGFDFTTFLNGERRYGGLSGNPNTSGGQTVLGLWFSMSLIFRAKNRLLKYWGAFSFI